MLILGTAAWGWTIDKKTCFDLLDAFLASGGRHIDAATNYPIDKNPAHFRASEGILAEYIRAHGLHDLQVIMKIGALDNMRSSESNLAPSFISMIAGEYQRILGANLHAIMPHWDNRTDPDAIGQTYETLQQLENEGVAIGLSGLAHPNLHLNGLRTLRGPVYLELKHHIFHSDFGKYRELLDIGAPKIRPLIYGINAGGVKLDGNYTENSSFIARQGVIKNWEQSLEKINTYLSLANNKHVRPPIKTMNQLGLIFAALHPEQFGIIVGVSSAAQWKQSVDTMRDIETFDYSDVYGFLNTL